MIKTRNDNELHKVILNNISDAVFMTDEAGRFTFICPNSHVIFGFTSQEIARFSHINRLLGNEIDTYREFDHRNEVKNIEITIADKFKNKHILLVNIKRIHIDDSKLLYTCRDITEKNRLHEELYNRKRILDILIEKAPIGIVTCHLNGNYRSANKFFCEIVGYSKKELSKMNELMLVHFNSIEMVKEMYELILKNANKNYIYDVTYVSNKGVKKFIKANSVLLTDKSDTPLFILSIIEDITRNKLQQEKREHLIRLLQENYNGINQIISLVNELSMDKTDKIMDFDNSKLTEKEKQVIFFITEGYSIKAIADKLFIAEVTVKKHISSIYKKYGAKNRIELINKIK